MGFQVNTTIQTALWLYKPDLSLDPIGEEFCVNLNLVQYIKVAKDKKTVWFYFAQTSVAGTESPFIIKGISAQQFATDLETIFV